MREESEPSVQLMIGVMIFMGSALMVYNIVRYSLFVRMSLRLEQQIGKNWVLIIPLFLLIFFLVGYVLVGLGGLADLVMASILLGGSVFVFLLLTVMVAIVDRQREVDQVLANRYEDMREEVDALRKDTMAAFRVNLTTDEVEERTGDYLYDSDLENDRYSELLRARQQYVADQTAGSVGEGFTREELLRRYQEGQTRTSEELLVRRKDGELSFVRLEATLSKKPVSGDVVAFITERPCNEDVVLRSLLENVLMHRYDRIGYIVDGKCHVVASNYGKKAGLLLPAEDETYESLYLNYILPAQIRDREKETGQANPLRLSVIEKALERQPTYEVRAPFLIEGERRIKHFTFLRLSHAENFILMLLSDALGEQAPPEQEPIPAEGPAVPAEGPAAPAEETTVPAPASAPAEEAPMRPLRILLVDDNEINRELGELMLSSEGHTVGLACDGAEAVEMLRTGGAGAWDLVLMDVHMTGMDGYEATAKIRAFSDPALAAIPIIALTADAEPESAAKALAAGMDAHAAKPIDLQELRTLAERLLPGAAT